MRDRDGPCACRFLFASFLHPRADSHQCPSAYHRRCLNWNRTTASGVSFRSMGRMTRSISTQCCCRTFPRRPTLSRSVVVSFGTGTRSSMRSTTRSSIWRRGRQVSHASHASPAVDFVVCWIASRYDTFRSALYSCLRWSSFCFVEDGSSQRVLNVPIAIVVMVAITIHTVLSRLGRCVMTDQTGKASKAEWGKTSESTLSLEMGWLRQEQEEHQRQRQRQRQTGRTPTKRSFLRP